MTSTCVGLTGQKGGKAADAHLSIFNVYACMPPHDMHLCLVTMNSHCQCEYACCC
jgi:hypothetical protein